MPPDSNIKIIGAGPTGLLLALSLSKLKINIYLYDLLSKDNLISKDKTYAITHSTRRILINFKLWEKLEPYIYSFDSLSISDTIISQKATFLVSDLDSDIKSVGNIGWVIKHSVLSKILFDELSNYQNFYFSNNKRINSSKKFDFEFFADGANSIYRNYHGISFLRKSYNQSCLTFKVLLNGNIKKRAYEIFRKEGPLALLPLSGNIYQIIWTSSTETAKERLNINKNLLLDNLSAILPKKINLFQIIGEVNIFPVSLSLTLPDLSSNNSLVIGDAMHTFHPVGGQGLNSCWRDVNQIYHLLKRYKSLKRKRLISLKFKFNV